MLLAIGVTVAALVALVVADTRDWAVARALSKTAASTGFVAIAVSAGATASPFGWALLTALGFSWLGDVALLGKSDASFRSGLVLFLLGHLGFCGAFVVRGIAPVGVVLGAVATLVPAVAIYRWLARWVHGSMWIAVRAYLVVIGSMVALSIATTWSQGSPLFILAATLFFTSDLLVAREKFVATGAVNRIVGLPLYYAAQLLFAATLL